jgi:hypothetical protein
MAKFTDLPVILASTPITDAHVFAVATSTTTSQLSLTELQKSMTGLTARVDSFSIIGKTVPSGLTVGDNGYVGVDNFSPSVSLDIGDYGGQPPEVRLRTSAAAREASYSLFAPDVVWRTVKKASDTDYYIQVSQNAGTNYTGVFNIDVSGRVGIFTGVANLTDQLYVSGGTIKFETANSGISFNPQNADISSTASSDPLTFNYSSQNDVIIGTNVLYIENGTNSYVGINNITPEYPLDISGAGLTKRIRSSTSSVSEALANTANTGYINLNSNSFSIGPTNGLSNNNLVYNISTKRLGVGEYSMSAKLHVATSDYTNSIFETQTRTKSELVILNSYASGPVDMALMTFATGAASSLNRMWSAGFYNTGSYLNSFALLYGGGTNNSAAKFIVDNNGDVNAKGSYTTDDAFCKGKFIQVHHTRVTGNCIYFNPFFYGPGSCNTNPSGHTDSFAPFSITPYAGTIEEIQLVSSDSQVGNVNRLEIVSVLPVFDAGTPDGFVSGFFISPPSNPATFPTSGIIGYVDVSSMTRNTVKRATKNLFQGSTAFSSGRLLQYRICETNGGKTSPVDFTIISKISYTVV